MLNLSTKAFVTKCIFLLSIFFLISCGGSGDAPSDSKEDTIAPVVTIVGPNPLNLNQGDTYVEPGATATDDVDGNVPVTITGTVDTGTPDTYTLTYSATDAASLGCRFATSFRGVVDQGRVADGEWVAVHGCGGVGLSAVMIARAFGARVIAIDIDDTALELAAEIGAAETVNASGEVHLTHTVLRGCYVIRMCVGALHTQPRHVAQAWKLLKTAAKQNT